MRHPGRASTATTTATVQYDMDSVGDYTANADIKYAYYSEASGVMVAHPKTSESLLIMTIVPAYQLNVHQDILKYVLEQRRGDKK